MSLTIIFLVIIIALTFEFINGFHDTACVFAVIPLCIQPKKENGRVR